MKSAAKHEIRGQFPNMKIIRSSRLYHSQGTSLQRSKYYGIMITT